MAPCCWKTGNSARKKGDEEQHKSRGGMNIREPPRILSRPDWTLPQYYPGASNPPTESCRLSNLRMNVVASCHPSSHCCDPSWAAEWSKRGIWPPRRPPPCFAFCRQPACVEQNDMQMDVVIDPWADFGRWARSTCLPTRQCPHWLGWFPFRTTVGSRFLEGQGCGNLPRRALQRAARNGLTGAIF
jgi:hypothetical protein